MNIRTIIYFFIFAIFAISCNKSVIESETLTQKTNELKAATIGTTYYVSKTGSDSNSGTITSPFLTIAKGISVAAAGDVVIVRAGTYHEELTVYGNNGTATSPITFRPQTGESVIIDGGGTFPTTRESLVMIYSNYVNMSGFEIENSQGHNLMASGTHCTISKINSHGAKGSGVFVMGDYSIVEDCQIWNNALSNYANPGTVINASGLSAARSPNYAILRRNVVYDNWGEGLSTFASTHTIIEDNIVYDNWSANIYLADATNVMCRRNFVYRTKDMTKGDQIGILIGDETLNPKSDGDTIIYNIVYGCRRNFEYWGSNGASGMSNFLIANNTFVNSAYYTNVWLINNLTTNSSFKNNIIYQDISGGVTPVYVSKANSEMHYSNNCWSSTPSSLASGLNDIISNAKFTNISSPYLAASYALASSSPCINKGVNMGFTSDFLNKVLISLPDMGAIEYNIPITTPITYYNSQVSATSTKNSCGTGYTGSTEMYTVSASKYSSTISQANADSIANADLNNNKQAYANANGKCTAIPITYYNTTVSATATKNSCGTNYTGSTVTYTVTASKYSSTVSQADADSKATTDINTNKQTYANTNGTCTAIPVTIYYNSAISGTATKNDCGAGYTGSVVTGTVPAKYCSSTVSQADANNKAAIILKNNIQAYANANGKCTRKR